MDVRVNLHEYYKVAPAYSRKSASMANDKKEGKPSFKDID